jgi:HB1, ASXL, restriction endonuclease HTH domain/Restriction endonuclease
MTFTEAAAEVLRLAGKPLHYKEITELAIEKNLLSHVGKSPEVTMGARLAALLKKEDKTNPIVRIKPGVFGLRDWSDKKGKRGHAAEEPEAPAEDDSMEVNALEVEAATREAMAPASEEEDDDDKPIVSGEDALRADLAASGAEMFDDEDDDDQPILAPPGAAAPASSPQGDALGTDGGRRRRRRRRRGRGGSPDGLERAPRFETAGGTASPIQPTAIISVEGDSQINASRDPLAPAPRPLIRDRQQIMAGGAPNGIEVPLGEGEELAGKELADAAVIVLNACDRNAGPVTVRAVADALMRRGRLPGDPAAAMAQLAASLRADNMRRAATSVRPRFRFANGSRVALTDWSMGPDTARLEQDVMLAIERYREASRRVMLRKLQELPGHAFIELALMGLERVGMVSLRGVRRAGSPGGEAHFSGIHKTGSDEIRTAIVIRKDGREIGRERVSDLRGALHHYGPASSGWLLTTGQVLSGAREEAGAIGAPPIALYDGLSFARLLEENDVAVTKTRFAVAIPDLELLETLRG